MLGENKEPWSVTDFTISNRLHIWGLFLSPLEPKTQMARAFVPISSQQVLPLTIRGERRGALPDAG